MLAALDMNNLERDNQDLQAMLKAEQAKLIEAQNACLRLEGALTYNAQCIAYLENLQKEADSKVPPAVGNEEKEEK